jgi:site-specific recombinase XerD
MHRTELSEAESAEAPAAPASATSNIPLAEALKTYLGDKQALGLDSDTTSTYRRDTTPFVTNCKADCVEKISRQNLIDYMKWQRSQPLPKRKHSNPERTYHNRLINVRSFLNAFGVTKLFRKGEYNRRWMLKKG